MFRILFRNIVSPRNNIIVFAQKSKFPSKFPSNFPSKFPISSMHKNVTCTLIPHATFFKITSTKYPNFTVKPLYLLWWCRGEDNLGIGLLASKKAVQYISRSLVLAQSFLRYGVSKSTGQTTSKSPWGPTYRRNERRKDPKYFRILSTSS
jgi:hypothetical protein